MKDSHEKILKILNPEARLEWKDKKNASFVVGDKSKKFIEGNLSLPESGLFSLEIVDTNYSSGYLNRKLGRAAAELDISFYKTPANTMSFSASVVVGDNIWIYSDRYAFLTPGQETTLPKGTEYLKVNGEPLACNPIGNLKRSFPCVFDRYQPAKCSSNVPIVDYAVFQLK